MSNDCGPDSGKKTWYGRLFSWVLSSDLIPGGRMNNQCKIHDVGYGTLNKPKAESDKEFLWNSLKRNWWNPYGIVKSFGFYAGVAIGGDDAYQEAQRTARAKEETQRRWRDNVQRSAGDPDPARGVTIEALPGL